ncbi:NUDIX hydrolase [Kallotenue papyrolyticum]|uniref:NUDIX hydrolase n=1 Tax=Kallotenue papyrolyticum TaxID=1325125 RepID=UPI00049290FB|nr:NUDIX hydrolase [Kallotenue papyrolyticum]
MITFDRDRQRFNYRVAAVILDRGRVLLHRAEHDDFWVLPGGRAELMEPATETIRRELREELGVEARVERLLWVVENFFSYADYAFHELALYFLVELAPDSPLRRQSVFDGREAQERLIFRWFDLATLERVRLFPSFLRTALRSLPATVRHIVHTDAPG